jgi:NTE family protein/lysophospholipid hydrolase
MNESGQKLASRDIVAFFKSIDLFRELNELTLAEFENSLHWVRLSGGESLMQQGDPADCIYFLVNGRLRVVVEHEDGSETAVGEISRGEVVGEMAILTDEPRSATVRALRDSELLMFSKEDFERLLERHPEAMMKITRQIVKRLQRSIRSHRAENTVHAIAVVPAGKGAPLSLFVESLAEALESIGPTLRLSSEIVDRHLEPGAAQTARHGPNNNRIVSWLNEQEAKYRYVIYESDTTPSNWTRRSLRQADRVLSIGRARSDPQLSLIEKEMRRHGSKETLARVDLVLLHDDSSQRPSNTRTWLDPRQVHTCQHLRLDHGGDFNRLTRLLTGRAMGIVLGGGGARGLSHVGALRAIEELQIPIDAIGGTSMGAIIAALYTMDSDIEKVYETCKTVFVDGGSLLDFTFPAVSLTSGGRIGAQLGHFFGDTKIEDLWLKFFCVSSNLTRAEVKVHRQGEVWRQVRASISLPGILPPVYDEGDLLVDGGVTNNLPVDVMRTLCDGGTVIALDVSPKVDMKQKEPFGDVVSGWNVLRHRVSPFREPLKVPPIASLLMRTTLLGSSSTQNQMAREADLCLTPPLEEYGLLEFGAFEKISEIGYKYAMERLREWTCSSAT